MESEKIRVIAHTHWDKEWYFTSAKSLLYSLTDFDEIIDVLEKTPEFTSFLLDGQLSIVEEYLELHPHQTDRFKKLVDEKRIIIGPWYTQPDTLVISGESLLKNLELGILSSKNFGAYQKIGYLPDSFGMSSQMPQIYNHFGLRYAFFRRGIAKHLVDNREFMWSSPDGTKIFTHNLHHYGNMAYPPVDLNQAGKYFHQMVEKLSKDTKSNIVLLYNGEDQKPIRKNLPELIAHGKQETDYDIEIASLESVFDELSDSYQSEELPHYQGEFTFGQFSRVHKSIFSTRADLKSLNNRLEHYLSNIVEPISALGYALGFSFEQVLIDKIWKLMLLNSAHDSIGNCNSDQTNRDIESRYIQARRLSEELVHLTMRKIGNKIPSSNISQFQVFNLLPYTRNGVMPVTIYIPWEEFIITDSKEKQIDYHILGKEDVTTSFLAKTKREIGVDNDFKATWPNDVSQLYKYQLLIDVRDVPAFGYQTYQARKASKTKVLEQASVQEGIIENEIYRISFEDSKLTLEDKRTQVKLIDFLTLIDDGDEGDSYDYSDTLGNKTYTSRYTSCSVTKNSLSQTLTIEGCIEVPMNLSERKKSSCDLIPQAFQVQLSLTKESDSLQVLFTTTNVADEHRVRLCIHTHKNHSKSYSDIQFGTIERPVYLEQVEHWEEQAWDEKPRTIEPLQSYVATGFSLGDVQVMTQDVREYQFIGDHYDTIAMTLYRSTPYLGRSDLLDRPGRASGTIVPTEGTRFYNQEVTAEYFISLLTDQDSEATAAQRAKERFTPLQYTQATQIMNNTDCFVLSVEEEKTFPIEYSMLELAPQLCLSTVTKARNSQDLLVRVFNSSLTENTSLQWTSKKLKQSEYVNGLEVAKEAENSLRPCEFRTIRVTLNTDNL